MCLYVIANRDRGDSSLESFSYLYFAIALNLMQVRRTCIIVITNVTL